MVSCADALLVFGAACGSAMKNSQVPPAKYAIQGFLIVLPNLFRHIRQVKWRPVIGSECGRKPWKPAIRFAAVNMSTFCAVLNHEDTHRAGALQRRCIINFAAASTVFSTSASLCAVEINPASNC